VADWLVKSVLNLKKAVNKVVLIKKVYNLIACSVRLRTAKLREFKVLPISGIWVVTTRSSKLGKTRPHRKS
jgi:hypothetical protein